MFQEFRGTSGRDCRGPFAREFSSPDQLLYQDLAFWPGEKLYSQYEEVMTGSSLFSIFFTQDGTGDGISWNFMEFVLNFCLQGDMMYFIRSGRVRLEASR